MESKRTLTCPDCGRAFEVHRGFMRTAVALHELHCEPAPDFKSNTELALENWQLMAARSTKVKA